MTLTLLITTGVRAGQKIDCSIDAQTRVGRDPDRAQFIVPADSFVSGAHFAVEHRRTGWHVVDLNSSNGTFLNEKRIAQALLANGDEIRIGQTRISVTIAELPLPAVQKPAEPQSRPASASTPAPPPPSTPGPKLADQAKRPTPNSPRTPVCVIGGWSFSHIPPDWEVKEGVGMLQKAQDGGFQSNITAMEELLGKGVSLENYVEAQIKMLREYLREPKIEPIVPPKIQGAEDSVGIQIRYATKDGQMVHMHRIYVRNGSTAGVASLTTLEAQAENVAAAFQRVLSYGRFMPD